MRCWITERRETMNNSRYFDPADRSVFMRLFYRKLAPNASWLVGQSVCVLVVQPWAAAAVPGRLGSPRSQIRPQTVKSSGHCYRGGQTLPRVDAGAAV